MYSVLILELLGFSSKKQQMFEIESSKLRRLIERGSIVREPGSEVGFIICINV